MSPGASGAPITVLHIGPDRTVVTEEPASRSKPALRLAIGSSKTAGDYFKHIPPTPLELENAIAAVEDEVARARTFIAQGSTLFTVDALIREIGLTAGVSPGAEMTLTLDAVERTFQRLVARALGAAASGEAIPAGNELAATLLILREFMHHLQFPSIVVKTRRTVEPQAKISSAPPVPLIPRCLAQSCTVESPQKSPLR